MNEQQLEYVRIRLRDALLDDSGGTKGQLEAFAEHPPADKNLHPRKQVHVVELDNGHGGVRRINAENSALYVMETRSRRCPMPPIRDGAFTTCAWRRAVLKLDEGQHAWIRYCYGFDLYFEYQMHICSYIWETFEKGLDGKRLQKRVKQRLLQLVWLAVQDVAARNSNDTYKEYAAITLANLLSVHRDTWYQTYATPWKELRKITEMLDVDALNKINIYVYN